jgi:hypothetical protein
VKRKPQKCGTGGFLVTNYEKIKAMSVEEMVQALADGDIPSCANPYGPCDPKGCKVCFENWLLQEAE